MLEGIVPLNQLDSRVREVSRDITLISEGILPLKILFPRLR